MLRRSTPAFGPSLLFALLLVWITLLPGCATVKTFDEQAYAAAETVKQVQITTTTLLKAGKITPVDAQNVLKATDAAVEGIAVARVYKTSAPATADTKLKAVLAALTLTQAYLATQGGK